jgi:hypothetical protein
MPVRCASQISCDRFGTRNCESHHSPDISNSPPELMSESPGNLLVEFCKCHTSISHQIATEFQEERHVRSPSISQGIDITTAYSGTALTSSERSPDSRIVKMTVGFTPHLMATPRRRSAGNPLPGAPTYPISPGNHIATDSSSFPSRPD